MFDAINATHQKIGHVKEKRHFEKPRINGKRQTGNVPFVSHIFLAAKPLIGANVMSGELDIFSNHA
ncbi:hypothetical protein T4E_10576 [Trichinella pseudospiralis]|uniref:Uncharacterized protein n=1 Tax=Trichinella pseudospiralis TaxID=6337 RepID=A0A0V0YKE8_TRIPS|nr:hypothetical protein T4E_10576 [Trichinella pseudospiralis]